MEVSNSLSHRLENEDNATVLIEGRDGVRGRVRPSTGQRKSVQRRFHLVIPFEINGRPFRSQDTRDRQVTS